LKLAEQNSWNGTDGLRQDTTMKGIFEAANDTITFAVGEAVTDNEPLLKT